MKIRARKIVMFLLMVCLVSFMSVSFAEVASAKTTASLSRKKVAMTVGEQSYLYVYGATKKVKWQSSNKKVVSVTKNGQLKAKKAGKAKITAKVGSKKLVCKVTVKKPKKYTVKFETYGGTVISPQTVVSGKTIKMPANPTKAGVTFKGWYTDSKFKSKFYSYSTITKNTTLYAMWAENVALQYSTKITENDTAILSVEKSEFYTGSSSSAIFHLESTVVAKSVTLKDASGTTVCTLYDDGKYSAHKDDIAGDGIYSGSVSVSSSAENLDGKQYYATITVGSDSLDSNKVKLYFVKKFTSAEKNIIGQVDEALKGIFTKAFEEKTVDEKKADVEAVLTELETSGKIVSGSVVYVDEAKTYNFKYNVGNGIAGAIVIEDLEADVKAEGAEIEAVDEEIPEEGMTEEERKAAAQPVDTTEINSETADNSAETGLTAIVIHDFQNSGSTTSTVEEGWIKKYNEYVDANLGDICDITTQTAATVETYMNLTGYDMIIINSHGKCTEGDPSICLREPTSATKDDTYAGDLKLNNIIKAVTSSGEYYWIRPGFFSYHYSNNPLKDSIVYMGLCQGYGKDTPDTDLVDDWCSVGASAVYAYLNSVSGSYDYGMLNTITSQLASSKTTSEALATAKDTNGADDGGSPAAVMYLTGDTDKYLYNGLRNGTFDGAITTLPTLRYWKTYGDARAVYHLGGLLPKSMSGMAIITTGMGSSNSSTTSYISQMFTVPSNIKTLSFTYNMISEEPTEWIDKGYNDTFVAEIYDASGKLLKTVAKECVDDSTWYCIDGIDFEGGDSTVFHTRWKTASTDISAYAGKNIIIKFKIYDLGDTIYDSAVLIDNVVLK